MRTLPATALKNHGDLVVSLRSGQREPYRLTWHGKTLAVIVPVWKAGTTETDRLERAMEIEREVVSLAEDQVS